MSFKAGDRVLIVSLNETGSVIGPSRFRDLIAVDPDHPEKFTPKERDHNGDTSIECTIHVEQRDLKHLNSSKPEADWKDIWDESSN